MTKPDAAWSGALDAMPTSDLKAGLLLEKARREPGPQDVRDVLAALALTPPATGHTLFSLHSACRELRNRDHDLFDRLWQEQLTTGQPPWLFLDDVTPSPSASGWTRPPADRRGTTATATARSCPRRLPSVTAAGLSLCNESFACNGS